MDPEMDHTDFPLHTLLLLNAVVRNFVYGQLKPQLLCAQLSLPCLASSCVKACSAHLAVEGDAVAAVVVSVEGLCAEAAACIPDGHCLIRGSCAEVVAEGLPTHLIHRVHMAPAAQLPYSISGAHSRHVAESCRLTCAGKCITYTMQQIT